MPGRARKRLPGGRQALPGPRARAVAGGDGKAKARAKGPSNPHAARSPRQGSSSTVNSAPPSSEFRPRIAPPKLCTMP